MTSLIIAAITGAVVIGSTVKIVKIVKTKREKNKNEKNKALLIAGINGKFDENGKTQKDIIKQNVKEAKYFQRTVRQTGVKPSALCLGFNAFSQFRDEMKDRIGEEGLLPLKKASNVSYQYKLRRLNRLKNFINNKHTIWNIKHADRDQKKMLPTKTKAPKEYQGFKGGFTLEETSGLVRFHVDAWESFINDPSPRQLLMTSSIKTGEEGQFVYKVAFIPNPESGFENMSLMAPCRGILGSKKDSKIGRITTGKVAKAAESEDKRKLALPSNWYYVAYANVLRNLIENKDKDIFPVFVPFNSPINREDPTNPDNTLERMWITSYNGEKPKANLSTDKTLCELINDFAKDLIDTENNDLINEVSNVLDLSTIDHAPQEVKAAFINAHFLDLDMKNKKETVTQPVQENERKSLGNRLLAVIGHAAGRAYKKKKEEETKKEAELAQ